MGEIAPKKSEILAQEMHDFSPTADQESVYSASGWPNFSPGGLPETMTIPFRDTTLFRWPRACRKMLYLPALITMMIQSSACSNSNDTPATADCILDTDSKPGFASSDCYQIYYEVHGEGEPLILVHGWSLNIESNWKSTGWIEALSAVRQVIVLDIRGHGNSDKPHEPEAYGYAAMARDIISVMDHLGIAQADLVGYSLGAFSSVHLLGHKQDRFRSVAMIGIGDEDEESLALAPVIAEAMRAEDESTITDPKARLYRVFAQADPRNDLEALAVSALKMWPDSSPLQLGGPGLGNVSIPVLIVNGENDIPYVYTDQNLAAAIPGARLVEIPETDHLGVLYDPRFKDTLLDFLTHQ